MTRKQVAILVASVGAVLAIVARLISGEVQLDGITVAALWAAASPAIGLVTAKAAVDQHVADQHGGQGSTGSS